MMMVVGARYSPSISVREVVQDNRLRNECLNAGNCYGRGARHHGPGPRVGRSCAGPEVLSSIQKAIDRVWRRTGRKGLLALVLLCLSWRPQHPGGAHPGGRPHPLPPLLAFAENRSEAA
jgi:hypothetical protein